MPAPDHPTFIALLDSLIPAIPERGLGGAGALGVGTVIASRAAGLLPALDPLIDALDARNFTSLEASEREAVLQTLEPDLAGLLGGLVFQTYVAYYGTPAVLEGLGLEARPPHPQGYPLESGDLSGLEVVRSRGPIYRDA